MSSSIHLSSNVLKLLYLAWNLALTSILRPNFRYRVFAAIVKLFMLVGWTLTFLQPASYQWNRYGTRRRMRLDVRSLRFKRPWPLLKITSIRQHPLYVQYWWLWMLSKLSKSVFTLHVYCIVISFSALRCISEWPRAILSSSCYYNVSLHEGDAALN